MRARGREGGFALVIVLWSLALVTLLLTQVTASGRTEAQLAANLRQAAALRAQTDGLVYLAIYRMLDRAQPWAADGAPHRLRLPGVAAELRVVDEAGKVNLNNAPFGLLAGLLVATGAPRQDAAAIAAEIVAWRVPPSDPAEAQTRADRYRGAGRDYAPPGAPFRSLGELGLVLGVTPQVLARLAPHLTLYTDAGVDPAAADPAVQQALEIAGMPQAASPAAAPAMPTAVTISVEAQEAGGAAFRRQAVVTFRPLQDGPPFQIASWSAP